MPVKRLDEIIIELRDQARTTEQRLAELGARVAELLARVDNKAKAAKA
jgi:hypothetical protein